MKNSIQPYAVFERHGGVANAGQLLEEGVTYYQLNKLLKDGRVIRLKQGLYRWHDAPVSEWAEVAHIVKQGVFCLYTACFHYNLTTFVSGDYHVAIPKKDKVVLPDYPPIKLYYWEETAYETGMVKMKMDRTEVAMYDLEKTVCDLIRYQKKAGLEVLKEVLKNYLGRKDRNLQKLSRYAGILNIQEEVDYLVTLLI